MKHFNATGQGPVLNQRLELSALHRNGREFPVELTIWPIKTGETYTFNAFLRDITERKEAETKIQRLNQDLEKRALQLEMANQELESFSYSVSHDLRAPLRHVGGFVDLLVKNSRDSLDAKGQRYLKIIGDSARQMGQLIDDLLLFSRMGRSEMHSSAVDLEAMVSQARLALESDTRERKINWINGKLPTVSGDPAMLQQVWANLLGNAVKYTNRREVAEIEIGHREENGEHVFFVRDNGAGFDMQYAQKLFGVFQRLHRSDEFEGTGIGLANVRRIVQRHGGRTWAEGRPGEGATFYFTLPQ